jgi:hypothetical protein
MGTSWWALETQKRAYLIGVGGWYRWTVETQRTVYTAGEVCVPAWVRWNIQCVNRVFPADVMIGSHSSNAGGFNIGGGLTTASKGALASLDRLLDEVALHAEARIRASNVPPPGSLVSALSPPLLPTGLIELAIP